MAEAIEMLESLRFFKDPGSANRSAKYRLARPKASSDPARVGMMLSSFDLREAIAWGRPRTEGWKVTSGRVRTERRSGCGKEAREEMICVTRRFVARVLEAISSTFSKSMSRKQPGNKGRVRFHILILKKLSGKKSYLGW